MADREQTTGYQTPMLGQVLLYSGKITVQDLDAALAVQAVTGELLGEALVAAGALTEAELEEALAYVRRYSGRAS